MPRMRTLLLTFALVACGDSGNTAIDAAPPVTQDCATYCTEILANCTGTNLQFADMAHCTAACGSFAMGMAADKSGNTLGCRIYHAGEPAKMDPVTHCPHAGPGGDKTSVVAPPGTCGDACTSFCTLEIKACGVTGDAGGLGQYASQADCTAKCALFPNPTKLYSPMSVGDSLACRLYHATNAAIAGNATVHCVHTGPAGGPSMATCMMGTPASP
jgi:hypothetical protein